MSLLPLEGFVVAITADRRAGEQAQLFERRGAQVMLAPAITTEYLTSDDAIRRATEAVLASPPDDLIATTGIGVRAWFEAAQAWGWGDDLVRALASTRVLARGPKAAAAVHVAGLEPHRITDSERLADLVERLVVDGVDGRVIALQHSGRHDADAVDTLMRAGATVVEVPVYRYTSPADPSATTTLVDAICAREVDVVTFTSAPAVTNLWRAAADMGRADDALRAFNDDGVVAGCIGPVCADAARDHGIVAVAAPERGRLGLMVRVVTDSLEARRCDIRCASASLVVQGRAVAIDGTTARLTNGEAVVLSHLLRRPGAVVSKQTMLRSTGTGPNSARALEATIARLRRRLGPAGAAVRSVRGRGYCIDIAH